MIRAVVVASAIVSLSGCSAGQSASDCAGRFAGMIDRFPVMTSPLAADFIFEVGDQNNDALKGIAKMITVTGPGGPALARFGEGDFVSAGRAIMADGKILVGIRRPTKTAEDAVRQGCDLEDRYGTLRNIRLANTAAPSTDSKNEQ